MPFLGGYIGYQFALEKVVTKEVVVEKEIEVPVEESKNTSLLFPESTEFHMPIPVHWNVERRDESGTTRNYIFDEENNLIFELRHPMVVTSYPEMISQNRRTIETSIESIIGLDWLNVGNEETGFVRYSPAKNGSPLWQGRFEIIVPISPGSYAQSGVDLSTRYKSYQQFVNDQTDGQQLVEYYISQINYSQ